MQQDRCTRGTLNFNLTYRPGLSSATLKGCNHTRVNTVVGRGANMLLVLVSVLWGVQLVANSTCQPGLSLWGAEQFTYTAVQAPQHAANTGAPEACAPATAINTTLIPIQDAWAPGALRAEGAVFVMLNGRNEGLRFPFVPGCLGTLADTAARLLGADALDQSLRKTLFSPLGRCVHDDAGVEAAQHILVVLLNQEAWVWPGVAVGHSWWAQGALLTTKSLAPKVIWIKNMLTPAECDAMVEGGQGTMAGSPEKHPDSANSPAASRTSTTGEVGGDLGRHVMQRSAELARLPGAHFAERPQLLRYAPGQWYQPHTDYFNHYRWMPLAALREPPPTLAQLAAWAERAIGGATPPHAVPRRVRRGAPLYPSEGEPFQRAVLQLLLDAPDASYERFEVDPGIGRSLIQDRLGRGAAGVLAGPVHRRAAGGPLV